MRPSSRLELIYWSANSLISLNFSFFNALLGYILFVFTLKYRFWISDKLWSGQAAFPENQGSINSSLFYYFQHLLPIFTRFMVESCSVFVVADEYGLRNWRLKEKIISVNWKNFLPDFRRLEFKRKSHLGGDDSTFHCTFTFCSIWHCYTSLGSYLILESCSSDHSTCYITVTK